MFLILHAVKSEIKNSAEGHFRKHISYFFLFFFFFEMQVADIWKEDDERTV